MADVRKLASTFVVNAPDLRAETVYGSDTGEGTESREQPVREAA